METDRPQAIIMPEPQVGDTWAVPVTDGEGWRSGLVDVMEVDEPSRTCKVKVHGMESYPENQVTHVGTRWLQRNVLVERKAEPFGPQLQAVVFDLERQLNLLREMADRLSQTAAHELAVRQAACLAQGEAQEGTGDE